MRILRALTVPSLVVAAALLLVGCGENEKAGQSTGSSAQAGGYSAAAGSTSSQADPTTLTEVGLGTVDPLGAVLTGARGRTMYGFTKDVDGVSTCIDACATAWPPVIVDANFQVPAGGPAASDFTVISRDDGRFQLKIGAWPQYYFAGDGEAGQANGQGTGGVWFATSGAGTLIKQAQGDAAAPPSAAGPGYGASETEAAAAVGATAMELAPVGNLGTVMVGGNGHTLYAFTDDPAKQSICVDACAQEWPPVLVQTGFTVPAEYQGLGVGTFTRPDGQTQLVMGRWALYYFAGDSAPGRANGQGRGGKFFVVDAACKLVQG